MVGEGLDWFERSVLVCFGWRLKPPRIGSTHASAMRLRNAYFVGSQENIAPQASATRGCRLAWSRLVASGAIDAGSNPASPTKTTRTFCSLFSLSAGKLFLSNGLYLTFRYSFSWKCFYANFFDNFQAFS